MELIAKRDKVVEVAAVGAAGSAGCAVLLHRGGTFVLAFFMAWALVRSLRRLTNQVRHSCDRDKQSHLADLVENMRCARELHDARTVSQRARDIAGTALGPRGRFFAPPDACRLTQAD